MLVLIALPWRDSGLADLIGENLQIEARKKGIRMDNPRVVFHHGAALKELEGGACFDHCIVHDELPTHGKAEPAPAGGFALAKVLRTRGSTMPVTLLHCRTWTDEDTATTIDLALQIARNSDEGIRKLIERVLGIPAPGDRIDILVDLSGVPRAARYEFACKELPQAVKRGTLKVSKVALTTALKLSTNLDKDEQWEDVLQRLGGHLLKSLVSKQSSFWTTLQIVLNYADADDRSRVHFRLHPQQYEVAFEAIKHPSKELPWMLRAPVIRSLGDGSDSPVEPIMRPGELRPHKCLILLSSGFGACSIKDARGNVIETVEYRKLEKAREECREVEMVLRRAKAAGKAIDEPVIIGREDGPLTKEKMKSVLQSQTWDMVHYIGHTDYIPDRGYLIVDGPGGAEAVGIEEIAPHLQDTRFVYFSSCEGTKLAFVRRLALHGVPTVLGFRVKVPDQRALEHAACFYEYLLDLNSIEDAFHRTRLHFHKTYPRERLWACSSLIMQRG